MKSSKEDLELVRLYFDSQATSKDVELLEEKMLRDDQLRTDFLAYARLDAALPYAITLPKKENGKTSFLSYWPIWASIAAIVLFLFALNYQFFNPSNGNSPKQAIARFEQLENCRWMNPGHNFVKGRLLFRNDRIELSSGTAHVHFNTGAIMELMGPSILELDSANSAFLSLGRASVIANTVESQGFSIKTPSSTFVDLGTAFAACVGPDGMSRLNVTNGKVNLIVEEDHDHHLIRAGETIFVEPGKRKILTKIESGNESKYFIFPTISPPSQDDYADASRGIASVSIAKGKLYKRPDWEVNPLSLLDGKGQTEPDSPKESVFLEREGEAFGNLLIDLGQEIGINMINSYSWHQHPRVKSHKNRARQVFTLYGLRDQKFPNLNLPAKETGWNRIARVNSDQFFEVHENIDRPAQQACSIFASKGKIGVFRYLLIEVQGPTFFGEIDVFVDQ